MGADYLYGHGVEKDKVKAAAWFVIAARNDNARASENLEKRALLDNDAQVQEATRLADEWTAAHPEAVKPAAASQDAPAGQGAGADSKVKLGNTEYPYVDPQIQLALEAEGLSTGGKNTKNYSDFVAKNGRKPTVDDLTSGALVLDCANGEKTQQSIVKFKEKYKDEHPFTTTDANLSADDITFIKSKIGGGAASQDVTPEAKVNTDIANIGKVLGTNGTKGTLLEDNTIDDAEKDQLEPQLKTLLADMGALPKDMPAEIKNALNGLVAAISGGGVADGDAKLPSFAGVKAAVTGAAK